MRQSSAQQVDNTLLWKQEVHRRVAEHKGRKAGAAGQDIRADVQPASATRAAEAAARVAARYANAPSYSDMLAEEARAALRAAEAASRAAIEAQAAAENVLAGLQAASSATRAREHVSFPPPVPERAAEAVVSPTPAALPAPVTHSSPPPRPAAVASATAVATLPPAPQPAVHTASPSFQIRWDTDMPVRDVEPAPSATRPAAYARPFWEIPEDADGSLHAEGFEVVEAARPIHANLIQFPRELVAPRKVRPRRAEGGYATAVEELGQLSIFEVDPGSISTEPEPLAAPVPAAVSASVGARWSGITLDPEPLLEEPLLEERVEEPVRTAPATATFERQAPAAVAAVQAAPLNRRLMAAVVDFSLTAMAFLGVAAVVVARMPQLPSIKTLEMGSAIGLAAIGLVYLAFFFTVARATPGMKYARLQLVTLSGSRPARGQRLGRLAMLPLSLLPAGLGAVWALFDKQSLCWHDRLSGTYPRKA